MAPALERCLKSGPGGCEVGEDRQGGTWPGRRSAGLVILPQWFCLLKTCLVGGVGLELCLPWQHDVQSFHGMTDHVPVMALNLTSHVPEVRQKLKGKPAKAGMG